MISILGDYNYTFPKPIPLKLKLKDMLEDNVDEKYYLSDKMLEYITSKDDKYKVNENNLNINRSIACSKTTREGNTRADTTDYICDELPENFNIKNGCKQIYDLNYYNHDQSNRVYSPEYSSPTLRTKHDEVGTIKVTIENKALNETLEQNEIDDTCYIDTYNKRIDKDKSGTITTGVSFRNNTFLAIKTNEKVIRKYGLFDKNNKVHQAGSVYDKDGFAPTLDTGAGGYRQPMIEELYIKNNTKKGYLEATNGDGIDISSRMEHHRGTVQKGMTQTLSTMGGENNGVVVLGNYSPSNHEASRIIDPNYSAPTFKENHNTINAIQQSDLKIRKLTPRECFRLMGVKDEDYDKIAKNQSDSSLYHLAGDSIVVNVLIAIFKELI